MSQTCCLLCCVATRLTSQSPPCPKMRHLSKMQLTKASYVLETKDVVLQKLSTHRSPIPNPFASWGTGSPTCMPLPALQGTHPEGRTAPTRTRAHAQRYMPSPALHAVAELAPTAVPNRPDMHGQLVVPSPVAPGVRWNPNPTVSQDPPICKQCASAATRQHSQLPSCDWQSLCE